jgi:Secretion system C-terminal sorting domain
LYLSDEPANRNKWAFPAGVSIPGNGFITVWLDDDALQGPFHANFKLSATGEHVMFSDGDANVLDSLSFGQQLPDISFGRYLNGTGGFTFMPTTYNAVNSLTIKTDEPNAENNVIVFPNPVSDILTIRGEAPLQQIRVLNVLGQTVTTVPVTGKNETALLVRLWANGIYTLQVGSAVARFIVKH